MYGLALCLPGWATTRVARTLPVYFLNIHYDRAMVTKVAGLGF